MAMMYDDLSGRMVISPVDVYEVVKDCIAHETIKNFVVKGEEVAPSFSKPLTIMVRLPDTLGNTSHSIAEGICDLLLIFKAGRL